MLVESILRDLYGSVADVLVGKRIADKYIHYVPYNTEKVVDLLYRAIAKNGTIVVHADIDTDGFGSAYVFSKYVKCINPNVNIITMTNKVKEHGISKAFVEYLNNTNTKIDLVVVLDSSTNNIEELKGLNYDAVVIDHHEVLCSLTELSGSTSFGQYAIATNMAGDDIDEKLSGCAVLFYVLENMIKMKDIRVDTSNLNLEQWVGITLISDVIQLATERNQYFIEKLYNANSIETGLLSMMESLNIKKIDKNLVAYKIAPLVNSTIRGGGALIALQTIMVKQSELSKLREYKDYQDKLVKFTLNSGNVQEFDGLVTMDIGKMGLDNNLASNYCGVVAAALVKKYGKSAYVYLEYENMYKGSVRGLSSNEDYRQKCEDAGFKAMGHKAAFGLEVPKELYSKLPEIMGVFKSQNNRYISIGQQKGGIKHIECIEQLKEGGNLMLLAVANSRLSSNETLEVHTDLVNTENEVVGKATKYKLGTLELISFDELMPGGICIYPEFSNFGVSLYTSNIKDDIENVGGNAI